MPGGVMLPDGYLALVTEQAAVGVIPSDEVGMDVANLVSLPGENDLDCDDILIPDEDLAVLGEGEDDGVAPAELGVRRHDVAGGEGRAVVLELAVGALLGRARVAEGARALAQGEGGVVGGPAHADLVQVLLPLELGLHVLEELDFEADLALDQGAKIKNCY